MENENLPLFINCRYVLDELKDSSIQIYLLNNGVLKKVSSIFSKAIKQRSPKANIFYNLNDLSPELKEKVSDMAITMEELFESFKKIKQKPKNKKALDNDGVYNLINDSTFVLPIVGNFLPEDGINAYTAVIRKDGNISLNPILINFDCHWSDLFTGETKYGDNVFCLVSDLTAEMREKYIEDIITLDKVPEFLKARNHNLLL